MSVREPQRSRVAVGAGDARAELDRIEVRDAEGERIVLSYHWLSTLRTIPPLRIEPEPLAGALGRPSRGYPGGTPGLRHRERRSGREARPPRRGSPLRGARAGDDVAARRASHRRRFPVGGDNLHLAWVLAWVAHALPHGPARACSTATSSTPRRRRSRCRTRTSRRRCSSRLLWWIVGSGPRLLVNALFLASFVLCGLSAQAARARWGGQPARRLSPAGLLFAFAPQRFSHVDHVQLYAFWRTPLALLALDRFLRDGEQPLALAASVRVSRPFKSYASLYLAAFAAVSGGAPFPSRRS